MEGNWRRAIGLLSLQALSMVAILILLFNGWSRDLHVPLQFSRDALEYLLQSKGTIENGWWWTHPRLSAPLGFEQIAYPSNSNVDQALIWIVSLFSQNVSLCVNVAWAILVAVSAAVTTLCLVYLGASWSTALGAGVLFAISPYALVRNIDHFSLVIYLVPIPCTAALLVATGRLASLRSRTMWLLVCGCLLLGLNYIYYAFFGCFLILIAALMAFVNHRRYRAWRAGIVLAATICGATVVNLTPTFVVWARHGKPLLMSDKAAAESELYGLKLRHLVSPIPGHSFPPFRHWTELEDGEKFPLETENNTGRLGVIGTLGFMTLVWTLVMVRRPAKDPNTDLLLSAGGLAAAAILLGTIGGFGSVFSLLVSPDIRAYNRLVPFIHFFALLAFCLLCDATMRASTMSPRRWLPPLLMAAITAVGVYDQSHAAIGVSGSYESDRDELASLQAFVGALEARAPRGAMVFQLPVAAFPNDAGIGVDPNEQVKPYLVSRALRWSYPAFPDAVARWQRHLADLPLRELAAAVRLAGFCCVVVDRHGFADDARSVLGELGEHLEDVTIAQSDRYVAIDVSRISAPAADLSRLPIFTQTFGPASAGLPPCGSTAVSYFDVVGFTRSPSEHPPAKAPWLGDVAVSGWAVDAVHRSAAKDVDVVVDGQAFPSSYGVNRKDVATAAGVAAYENSGFMTRIPRSAIGKGIHNMSLRVVEKSGDCYFGSARLPLDVR